MYDQKKTGIIDHMDEIRWDEPSPHLEHPQRCGSAMACPTYESSRWSRLTHCT